MPARVDLSQFTIVPASVDQTIEHAAAAFVPWGRGRDFKDFLEGTQKEYDVGEWGKDGGLQAWVLVKRDNLAGEVYAACEAYRRKALIKAKGSNVVEEGYMYAIASVVTPVPHLKNGYATHLLRLLHYMLAKPDHLPPFPTEHWGPQPPPLPPAVASRTPGGIGSILWSDVGFKFYEKCTIGLERPGWVVDKSRCNEIVWKISDQADTIAAEGDTEWEWIYEKDIPALSQELRDISIKELLGRNASSTIYAPDPTSPGLLTWLHVRGPWLSHTQPPPNEPWGIRTRQATGEDSIVLFTAYNEHIGKRLLVSLIHNVSAKQLPSLLAKLDQVGARAGRTEGWVWGLDMQGELVDAWKKLAGRETVSGGRQEIDGHLLGVAWYGSEEETGEFVEEQMWDWC